MNILTKLSKAFQAAVDQIELEEARLMDGTVIEADAFEVGNIAKAPIEDGDSIELLKGKYDLDNGTTITVGEGGMINAVTPTGADEEPAVEEPQMAEEAATAKPTVATAKKVIESNIKETVFSKVEMSAVQLELSNALKEVEELKENVKALELEKSKLQESLDNEPAAEPLSRHTQKTKEAKSDVKLSASQQRINRILNRINK